MFFKPALAVAMAAACWAAGAHAQAIQAIATPDAPKAIGPYSQAIKAGNVIYVSGTLPIDPKTNVLDKDAPIEAQTTLILNNIKAVLAAEGLTLAHVVSTTVYMQDLNEFAKMNETYASFFTGVTPARATVQVARLPRDVKIEIGAIAVKP
ncbi:endoribonuclease L-PSP [Comamonas serinivorans]|uniref:Endoribonuclease L-PSP n=2 Tax=Comamonas serinivorans TaxID=1082851 RepID=A0A1Y0ETX6_9BURK|nr:endoribonuclease L-PSP [Comamonas serinivorans]